MLSIARLLFIAVLLGGIVAVAQGQAAQPPATQKMAGKFKGWEGAPDAPIKSGYHRMVYEWQEGGQTHRLPMMLYLPEGYSPGQRYPAIVFLAGAGERGGSPDSVMNCGIPADLGGRPEVRKWLPMIVLMPTCPSDQMWDTPGMPQAVVKLTRDAMENWPIDRSRMYLTGLSMGGKGCWAVAAEAPNMFAVVAPIVSREHEAEATAAKLRGSGTRLLIISGLSDGNSEPASKVMADAMRKASIDVTYVPVPGAGHGVWPTFYSSKEFYQWLLMHQRGQPAPLDRPTAEHLIGLHFANAKGGEEVQQKLREQFATFAPYWNLDNCANQMDPGLKAEIFGQKNVFVTHPLIREVACRLQLTQTLPPRPGSCLRLVGGRHPEGQWDLVVRIDEVDVFRSHINKENCPSGWFAYDIDLDRYQGREVRVQVVQQFAGSDKPAAYWREVRMVLAPDPALAKAK